MSRAASVYSQHGATVFRYVVTHVHHDGTRRLTLSANGSGTFGTRKEARRWLAALLSNNSAERLDDVYGLDARDTFRVDLVECWAEHFDPCASVYCD